MLNKNLYYLLLAVVIFGFTAANAVNIEPSNDMSTDPDQHSIPTTELWTADFDLAGHHERISMKFDLEPYMGQQIDSAFLNIYRFFRCPNHYYTIVDFYHITQEWNENTWPQSVHHPHGTTSWLTFNVGPDLGWYRIDITSMVQAWLNQDMENHGLVMQAQYGEKHSKFYSKEAAQNLRPYLEIEGAIGIEETNTMPADFTANVYPNPFNALTTISYNLPKATDISVKIYNILGHKVETLIDMTQPAGHHQVTWDAKDNSSGPYFYMIQAGSYTKTGKMLLLK
jgi:hypothetical protein